MSSKESPSKDELRRTIMKKLSIFGLMVPFIAFGSIGLAIYTHPWFSFDKNALSDLGAIWVPDNYIFNVGLIISGLMAIPFFLVLFYHFKDFIGKIGSIVFLMAIVSLISIGLFPEGTSIHYFVSVSFFMLSLVALLMMGASLTLRNRKIGIFLLFDILLSAAFSLIPKWPAIAIPETIGSFGICVWVATVSICIIKEKI
ncbi:MAG: DUF998 domain-containing protein [Candidatus Odinarchaeota archaeon]|nr:DUF998 domain-containing protein [Candidatus Odinarchaeota archaeon]